MSLERLHRLRPSDIETIKKETKRPDKLSGIIASFARYLLSLTNPRAVELDDVFRIALQLKAAGVWDLVRPQDFAEAFEHHIDAEVTSALRDALGANEVKKASGGSAAAKSAKAIADAQRLLGKSPPSDDHSSKSKLTAIEPGDDQDPVMVLHAEKSNQPRYFLISRTGLLKPIVGTTRWMSKKTSKKVIEKIAADASISTVTVKKAISEAFHGGQRELEQGGTFRVTGGGKVVLELFNLSDWHELQAKASKKRSVNLNRLKKVPAKPKTRSNAPARD